MLQNLLLLIFVLSVALAAIGVVLSSRLRTRYHHEIFSTLLYFQVFIFTFGFYGIWGQVVIYAFLSAYISSELLNRFADIAMLMGLPFLVFAWMMLIQFSIGISGRKHNNWLVFWFLLINFSGIILVGYFLTKANSVKPVSLIKNYFMVMNSLYTLLALLLILFPRKGRSIIHNYDRKMIATSLFLIMIFQFVPILFFYFTARFSNSYHLYFFCRKYFYPCISILWNPADCPGR